MCRDHQDRLGSRQCLAQSLPGAAFGAVGNHGHWRAVAEEQGREALRHAYKMVVATVLANIAMLLWRQLSLVLVIQPNKSTFFVPPLEVFAFWLVNQMQPAVILVENGSEGDIAG